MLQFFVAVELLLQQLCYALLDSYGLNTVTCVAWGCAKFQ